MADVDEILARFVAEVMAKKSDSELRYMLTVAEAEIELCESLLAAGVTADANGYLVEDDLSAAQRRAQKARDEIARRMEV